MLWLFQNAAFLRFYENILFLVGISWSLWCDFSTKIFIIASQVKNGSPSSLSLLSDAYPFWVIQLMSSAVLASCAQYSLVNAP